MLWVAFKSYMRGILIFHKSYKDRKRQRIKKDLMVQIG